MLEELGWFLLFLIFFVYSHYQIKYCIPITLFLLKFIQAACMLMLVKIYVFYRLYGNDMTGDIKTIIESIYNGANTAFTGFSDKFEL